MSADIANSSFELDAQRFIIRLHRVVDASPAAVFAAWTKPEELALWWDPEGRPLVKCEVDLRIGGHFTFVNQGHTDMAFTGTYREILPPSRLVFDALGAVGTVTLDPQDSRTKMTVDIRCANAEHFEHFVKLGVARDTGRTLDNLVVHAGKRAA